MSASPRDVAQSVAADFSHIPEVVAVALSGSLTSGKGDEYSDIDLIVYTQGSDPPIEARRKLIVERGARFEIDNHFWETEDGWIERDTGLTIDVVYRTKRFITDHLERVIVRHEASMGYSTAFWCNVVNSGILFDRNGWFAQLQNFARQPYPDPLRRAIIAKNYPILRDALSGYVGQIGKAVQRGDLVGVNHRIAAFLTSYFDIIFALNYVLHPGEKRMLSFAEQQCEIRPDRLRENVEGLLHAGGTGSEQVIAYANQLTDTLARLLRAEALIDDK
jgi:predicted nucleotidyltransferase